MEPDNTDRRRLVLAALVTVLAVPVLWWTYQDRQSEDSSTTGDPNVAVTRQVDEPNLPPPPTAIEQEPIFLDGPESAVGGISQIAVPDPDLELSIVTEATYGSLVTGSCLVKDVFDGNRITVINLDNNRTTTCRVSSAPADQEADLVMHTTQFRELADLTDAPIPVQIRLSS